MMSTLHYTNSLSWNGIVIVHRDNSTRIDRCSSRTHYPASGPSSVHCGAAANINFIVDCFDPIGLEPIIYHTHGEHTNYYTTDAVLIYHEKTYLSFNVHQMRIDKFSVISATVQYRVSKLRVTAKAVAPDTIDPRKGKIKSNALSIAINVPSFPNCRITNVCIALLAASILMIELALSFFPR